MPSFSANLRPQVVCVAFPDAKLLDLAGPMQVFTDAKRFGGENSELTIVSATGGDELTDTGVKLTAEPFSQWRNRSIHTLLISGGWGAKPAAKTPEVVRDVAELASQSTRVASVCTGAYILAATGLLDGCQAATHWFACDDLASKHPDVRVEPDRIFVKAGRICVRRQGIWNQERRNLREYLAHLIDGIMRRVCGVASAAVRVFFV